MDRGNFIRLVIGASIGISFYIAERYFPDKVVVECPGTSFLKMQADCEAGSGVFVTTVDWDNSEIAAHCIGGEPPDYYYIGQPSDEEN